MKREICPHCGKKGLEKMEDDPIFDELIPSNYETWGCIKCGQAFFRTIEKDNNETKGSNNNGNSV